MSHHHKLAVKFIKNSYNKNIFFVALCLVTMVILRGTLIFYAYGSENEGNKENYDRTRVLFISSYDSSFPTFFDQLQGLQSEFEKDEYQIDIEYMDSKRFYTEDNLLNFHERLKYKLSKLEPYHIIIAGDDNALQYVLDHKEELFNDIPVVFLGINDIERANIAFNEYNITGVVETTSIKGTLDIAFNVQEKATRLAIIVDDTTSGQGELKTVLQYTSAYPHIELVINDLSVMSYDELQGVLKTYGKDTVLLLIAAYHDCRGETMDFYEYVSFIKEYSNTPIYHLYNFGIGQGIFGGSVVDYYKQGLNAGVIAKEILGGIPEESIYPISDTRLNSTIFDYSILQEFMLDEKLFPIDASYINKPKGFFELNKEMALISAFIILFLSFVILILFINILRRRALEQALKENNQELIALNQEMMAMNDELEASEEELRDSYDKLQESIQSIEESEQRYKYVFELSHSGLWQQNILTDELFLTKEWYLKLFENKGYYYSVKNSEKELLKEFYRNIDPKQRGEIESYKSDLLSGKIAMYSLIIECCPDGSDHSIYISEKARALYNNEGDIIQIIGSHTDITSSVLYQQQLSELAYKDQLTKMPNRIVLEKQLRSFTEDEDKEIVSGCVMLINVDNFKFINNTYGHEIGDFLLQEISKRLFTILGENYVLGRISGDEFVVLCNNLHSKNEIDALATKLVILFDERFRLRERTIYITISIGLSIYPENGSDLDTLLNRANSAVVEAKLKGKNRFEYYDISMNETMENKIYIQNNIREAIENDRFMVYYQPLYSLKEDKIVGFEALIRWKDALRGFISPIEFIVVAEKMGLINRLGEWVLREAMKFAKFLVNNCDENLYISVNVSSLQLLQNDFVELVVSIMEDVGLEYKNLCLEITETALMQSFENNAQKLSELRKKGIVIGLDDFGTGYSSLNYLRQLPVDILKIDKTFIDEILFSKEGRDLAEGIILLAQKMGMYVIAEGIEKEVQLQLLDRFQCDGIQGYYISRPIPEKDVKEFYDNFIPLKI